MRYFGINTAIWQESTQNFPYCEQSISTLQSHRQTPQKSQRPTENMSMARIFVKTLGLLLLVSSVVEGCRTCNDDDEVIAYEGNGCTQAIVGSYRFGGSFNLKRSGCFDNDEARSMQVRGGTRQGSQFTVCDNPSDCCKDDYTWVEVIKTLPTDISACARTFEESYSTEYLRVTRKTSGDLDGKISRVQAGLQRC